jgi:flagellar biosynthetic protein FlhB
MLFVGGADYLYQWLLHRHELRMTHKEIREEMRQLEGDPHVRARIRRIRNERVHQHAVASFQNSTVIIVDATDCAVALKYDPSMQAPIVTAKGIDAWAQAIQESARTRRIPIVGNALLARALYAEVKVSQEISKEHYKAVAAIIRPIINIQEDKGSVS